MVRLSPRLQQVADLVDRGAVLADIGCGHGKLCLYCLQQGLVPRAIAVDCSVSSLSTAANAADEEGLELDCRQGDGLEPIGMGEATCAVIAGMGGNLITGILSRAGQCVPSLVLVPHKNADMVRKYLYLAHYRIVYDAVVPDGRFWYHVLKAVADADVCIADPDEAALLGGPQWYVGKDNATNPHFAAYRDYRLQRLTDLRNMGAADPVIADEIAALEQTKGD